MHFSTNESFGFVSLAEPELVQKINEQIDPTLFRLRPTLKFLSDKTGCAIAPQPFGSSKEERKLFAKLLLQAQQKYPRSDHQQVQYICDEIMPYVNRIITPKIPVYVRLYMKKFALNQHIKTTTEKLKDSLKVLHDINLVHQDQLFVNPSIPRPSVPDPSIQQPSSLPQPPSLPQLQPPSLPPVMPPICPQIFQPRCNDVLTFVGGVPMSCWYSYPPIVGPSPASMTVIQVPRGVDNAKRKRRRCLIWCQEVDCKGGKSGAMKKGEIRHCSKLAALICENPIIPENVAQHIASY